MPFYLLEHWILSKNKLTTKLKKLQIFEDLGGYLESVLIQNGYLGYIGYAYHATSGHLDVSSIGLT